MFYVLNNFSSMSVEPIDAPWDFAAGHPDPTLSKEAYKEWLYDPLTKNSLVSAFEGTSPVIKIMEDNPVVKMHGLIVDYDNRTSTTDKFTELAQKPICEWIPSYGSLSHRKGARLYWEFERPIPIMPGIYAQKFLERLFKELRIGQWLPGCDLGATANVGQYYSFGTEFTKIGGPKIKHAVLAHWAWDAMQSTALWSEAKQYTIPIEDVAAAVAERFPGKWKGQFTVGSRGVRFWDPSADNPTGAQVRADGCTCYTGDRAFMSWRDIFGSEFVANYAAEKNEVLLEHTFFEESSERFVYRIPHPKKPGEWKYIFAKKDDFSQYLRTQNFNGTKSKDCASSEIDRIQISIKHLKEVNYAKPLVHFPLEMFTWRNGKTYLNTGAPEPIKPAPQMAQQMQWTDGDQYFPLVKAFFDVLFADKHGVDHYLQLPKLFAWTKYFYECGLYRNPNRGHVLILAGPPGKGKGFFQEGILGDLMGGSENGTPFLVDDNKWTENIASCPVLNVADSKATEDYKTAASFSNNLKKIVANACIRHSKKFGSEGDIPWNGRIVVTCNTDAESLSILPNMEISNRDKVSMFKASDVKLKFPSFRECQLQLKKELPYFARFLLDWKIPDDMVTDETRFGVANFLHPDLFEASVEQGQSGVAAQMVHSFIAADAAASGHQRDRWSGTSSELYEAISMMNQQFSREFRSVKGFQTVLGHLRNHSILRVESTKRSPGHPATWTIHHPPKSVPPTPGAGD
jgi:hypothetical protein